MRGREGALSGARRASATRHVLRRCSGPTPGRWSSRLASGPAGVAWEKSGGLRGLDDSAFDLVPLERLEQRLEVSLAEAFVALPLDELEEDRAEQRLREDLQQQTLLSLVGRAVDEDAARLQVARVLAVSRQA